MAGESLVHSSEASETTFDVVVIGAGPAGLTSALMLSRQGKSVVVLENDEKYVGGIARTIEYKGFRFDIGGHRFFSKVKKVEDFWTDLLGEDFLTRRRSSRIYYKGEFFSYPLRSCEALFKLGFIEGSLCVLSYLRSKLFPIPSPANFEDWVTNQFGRRLYRLFFQTYTEKVWGMRCRLISADWAKQRIQKLSLGKALYHAAFPQRGTSSSTIRTLTDSFRYPRLGPGMMWTAAAEATLRLGGRIEMGAQATAFRYLCESQTWEVDFQDRLGNTKTVKARHLISTAALRHLISNLQPPAKCVEAANRLKYRDFITVALMLEDDGKLTDNWIYVHDPRVKVARIQNYKSWSPDMVPNERFACYGLEYFCFEGDGLWDSSDVELIEMAKREIELIGLANGVRVFDGCVIRQPKAYPVYDHEYRKNVETIRDEVRERYPGLHLVGRNGMHKYNNQDHSMVAAMLTVENILAGSEKFDVWSLDQDSEYHEEQLTIARVEPRLVPQAF